MKDFHLLQSNKPKQATSVKRSAGQSAPFSLGVLSRHRFQATSFRQSLGFAFQGLAYVFQTQRNFRIDLVIGLLVVLMGILLQIDTLSWIVLTLVMTGVLVAEALNTAIEYTVDLYTQGEFDMRAKVIKDIAASACLMMACAAAIVGGLVFIPHLWALGAVFLKI